MHLLRPDVIKLHKSNPSAFWLPFSAWCRIWWFANMEHSMVIHDTECVHWDQVPFSKLMRLGIYFDHSGSGAISNYVDPCTNPWGRFKWAPAITRLTVVGRLVICKHTNAHGHKWHWISVRRPKCPKTIHSSLIWSVQAERWKLGPWVHCVPACWHNECDMSALWIQ